MITFAAASVLRIEKIQIGRVLGVIFGAIAILLLIGPKESLPDPGAIPWILAALFAAMCYSAENLIVATRRPTGASAMNIALGLFLAGSIIMTPIVIMTDTFVVFAWPWGRSEMAIVGIAAVSVTAYSLFIYLISLAGPVFASQTAYVITFSGVIWGMVIFDEQHSIWIWASLAVMLIALMLVTPRKNANG